MVHETGSNSGAGESGRNAPLSHSATHISRRIFELANDVTIAAGSVTSLEASRRLDHRDAAARATAACGFRRDDAAWITECTWCARVRNTIGVRVMISEATHAAVHVEHIHGICPQCSAACIATRPALRYHDHRVADELIAPNDPTSCLTLLSAC